MLGIVMVKSLRYQRRKKLCVISETGFVCMYLVFQLSQLVNITSTVAGLAGSTHRVTELIERLQVIKTKEEEEAGDLAEVSSVSSEDGLLEKEKSLLDINEKIVPVESEVMIELDKVSFWPLDWDKDLISDLSLSVHRAERVRQVQPREGPPRHLASLRDC